MMQRFIGAGHRASALAALALAPLVLPTGLVQPSQPAQRTLVSGAWRSGPAFPGVRGGDVPALLSCASATFCVAVDQQLQQTWVLQGAKWRTGAFGASGQGVPTALDCTSSGTCTGADAQGDILTFAHDRWSARSGPSQQGGGPMSCATAKLCLFVNGVGQWFTWDGHKASRPQVAYPSLANTMGSGIYALSCAPGTSFCAAADSVGSLGTYSAGYWGPLFTTVKAPPVSVGCYSAKACLAAFRPAPSTRASQSGTWATWDGASWSLHDAGQRGFPPVPAAASSTSCSERACVVLDSVHGRTYAYRWSSGAWLAARPLRGAAPQLVACSPAGTCIAVTPGTSPAKPGATWSSR
jgi:hypothetical protein